MSEPDRRGRPFRLVIIRLLQRIQHTRLRKVPSGESILPAIVFSTAHCESYSIGCPNTIRTACSWTSGKYLARD